MQLSEQELKQRVALLTRFRQALVTQRERLGNYLQSLEARETLPPDDRDDCEAIEFHVDLERTVIREISLLERTLVPFEAICRRSDPAALRRLPEIRTALSRTRSEVLRRTEVSQELLQQQLDELRREVEALRPERTAPARRLPIVRPSANERRLVDVTA